MAHTKLSYSRAFIVRAHLLQTHEMLFDARNHAFRVFGGVPAGSGAFVLDKSSNRSFRMQPVAIDEARSFEQLMELIVAIEVSATKIAARNRTDDDLKKIKKALIGMEYAIASDRLGDEEDYAFHDAIVAATHNPHFIGLCKHLEFGARHVIRQARANTKARLPELMEAVQREHQAIFEAVKDGDVERAGEAAEGHLRNASQRMMIYLAADTPQ